ncbi:hypothetical protein ENSA5_37020 [Enhygromyxa salina]|uniref:HTH cro/C1-type domain-containing protein n=1 Tax=Enhygromyxa salina TaxID=215803 RepID=A0A2S9XSJ8_9BACT|nr:helix-turn-helix transcriptional regulator [Enhygromyxa salina]PRP95833.1 hypothetical protein ENSA5_37020 [Enhygromyxa salina]
MNSRPIHELVSENLRRLTEEKGVALAVVADRAGLDRREFFEVIAGEREGDFEWLRKVAEALDVEIAELVVDRSSPPS